MKKSKWTKFLLPVWILLVAVMVYNLLSAPSMGPVHFSKMEYTRPDMSAMSQSLEELYDALPKAKSADDVMDAFWPYYTHYINYATNYQLSFIHYSQNMTDIYWEQEYNYCLDQSAAISAEYDKLLRKLGTSKHRQGLEAENYFGKGFFDAFQGESLWDETLVELMDRENDLIGQYYDLSAQPQEYTDTYFSTTGAKMEQIYVELVSVRQEMATHAGYPDYPTFAYDFYHSRDYTPTQATTYMKQVRTILAPLLSTLDLGSGLELSASCTQEQTFAYVQETAKALGGSVWESFQTLDYYGLYDITPSVKKYPGSYEVFLYNYNLPFVFVNPTQQVRDKLVFTHEFGHFCNDLASRGGAGGTDVSEIFSQGLEYLSLFYGPADQTLIRGKLAECLNIFITQSVYASFEHQVYGLTGDGLTVENVRALYRQTAEDFGYAPVGWDSRDYVMLPHLYSSPMYLISYVVSNDAAMQLYVLEAEESGAGRKVYEDNLATEQESLLAFLKEAGLESPFRVGHLDKIADALEDALPPRKAA